MNLDTFRRIIADQKEEMLYRNKQILVKREAFDYAIKILDEPIAKVITGVRRCGKSTFCHQLLNGKPYSHINFDDERFLKLQPEELDILLEALLTEFPDSKYFLFDEIQNVNGWELFVNRLLRQGFNVLITGSNSKMLSRELATHLTGRHIQIELFPFSFKEFIELNGGFDFSNTSFSTKMTAELKLFLEKYMNYGGFPEINRIESKYIYLQELFNKIIMRDIVERYKIRDTIALKELATVAINSFSSLISYNKLNNSLGFKSINTVKDYLGYLEETYLLSTVKLFDYKLQESIKSPRKIYSIDSGMIKSMNLSLTSDTGRLLENLVYLHLKRQNNEIFYWKSKKGNEVDFVLKSGLKLTKAIQVSYSLENESTKKREFDSLFRIKEELGIEELYILTMHEEFEESFQNIKVKVLPIWKFLLNR